MMGIEHATVDADGKMWLTNFTHTLYGFWRLERMTSRFLKYKN